MDEGETVETPDDAWYREQRTIRRTRAVAELLLTQVYFKDKKDRKPFEEHIYTLIEGEKFDMARLKPKG